MGIPKMRINVFKISQIFLFVVRSPATASFVPVGHVLSLNLFAASFVPFKDVSIKTWVVLQMSLSKGWCQFFLSIWGFSNSNMTIIHIFHQNFCFTIYRLILCFFLSLIISSTCCSNLADEALLILVTLHILLLATAISAFTLSSSRFLFLLAWCGRFSLYSFFRNSL